VDFARSWNDPHIVCHSANFCERGERVIIQPPVYNHFYDLLEKCELEIAENNLIYENGIYNINFEDLEQMASDPKN